MNNDLSIIGRFWIKSGDKNYLGEGRVQLLRRIQATGSISQAAKDMGMSYKAAWDDVDAMNNLSETPLVVRSTGGKRGGGTSLTPAGVEILAYYDRLQAIFDEFIVRMNESM
ncbi:MAG: winged helix-turn-helix domain-containing protein [Deferribacteraceae bacterium]|nr:winged helix-turn-helix domain-containing protein [Deferribacteraceae bacterium]